MDLSGGQWQRLSIARMLYRRAGIRIWDEPTAAMDPLAESRLYEDFLSKREEAARRTSFSESSFPMQEITMFSLIV